VRIAIDARELMGRPTGVGRYLSQILQAWAALPGTSGHELVLCSPEALAPRALGDLRVSNAVAPGGGTAWEQWTLPRLVRAERADVLFAPAYTAPLRCPAPVVLTIHDVSYAAHPEWFSWRDGLRRRTLSRMAARRAARVITESDFSKREIARHLRVDAGRIEVIYLGVSALRADAPREPLVLYVGSVFNRRHVDALVGAFARLAAGRPGLRLAIVGDNRTRPWIDLDALVAGTGLADRIDVRSYVADDELSGLYARASAFAFLSEYEGFGLPPLEAMAAGVPVVVLDTPVAREIYGPAAEYVSRAEPDLVAAALDRVLTEGPARERLLHAGTAQVERYSWRECAHRTLQVLLAAS
jgi:glycosyltransferase involved in cell wall biosynthesis